MTDRDDTRSLVLAGTAWSYFKTLYGKYLSDASPILAGAIAYAALFSLFPIVLLGISISGYVIASPERQIEAIQLLTTALPVGLGDIIQGNVKDIVGGRGVSGAAAAIFLLLGALGVFGTLEYTLNRVLVVKRAPRILWSVIKYVVTLFLIFLLALLATLPLTARHLLGDLAVLSIIDRGALLMLYSVGVTTTSIIVSTLLFMVILMFIPSERLPLRSVWLPALAAASFWELAKLLFGWYLLRLARYALVYGSLGAVIALLTWIYVSVTILLLCATVIAIRRQRQQAIDT